MRTVGFALILLGLIFAIAAPISKKKNARCSMQTHGELKEVRRGSKRDNTSSDTYIYTYLVDGVEYLLKSPILSPEVNKVGDSCTIWYNPDSPKEAELFHSESARVYIILLVIGIVMVLLGIVLFVVRIVG